VVSAAQLYELGFTRQAVYRRVRKGRLHRLHTGVYAVGHLSLKPPAGQLAAVLACGSDALLSHDSAVVLWGLVRTYTGPIHVTAPRARKPRAGLVVHRSRLIHPDDRAVLQGCPLRAWRGRWWTSPMSPAPRDSHGGRPG
jgi:predicted transcriptional regulator of viral defense system